MQTLTSDLKSVNVGADAAERLERRRFKHVETLSGDVASASSLYLLRVHRLYWLATMLQVGLKSALVLSIITDCCCLD